MRVRRGLRLSVIGSLLLVMIVGAAGVGAAQSATSSAESEIQSTMVASGSDGMVVPAQPEEWVGPTRPTAQIEEPIADEDENEADTEDETEGGSMLLGEWWGLGGEANEAPYIGLVEIGVVILTLGLGGYMLGKRTSLVPIQYRRYLLPAHEWSMLLGTVLTVPHFLAVEEWEGLGLAVGVLLAVEVVSGVYGRHLHRHVIRLGRGDESPSIFGAVIETSNETLFSRWRWIHRSLTVVTAIVLVAHIVTAIGD
ncbi:hypothetical protein HLRTI_000183 [Halorhabdus tiamatea SARL4B]|uniref:Uncharacterized protein n=3 Tax=Halorhabdus TaxID=146825 RepID=U2FHY8_9EURY|nr:hypothetical protein [Halorhabdus tiamatea]ERJ07799.1 hypothetical protein HLRTI_000183 [Halorhabdus tiamatea SARL4B]